jgi:type I restriction enzyme S subunit
MASSKTDYTYFADGDIGVAKITPCFENLKSVVFANLLNGYGAGTTELHIFRNIVNLPDLAQYALSFFKSLHFTVKAPFSGQVGQQRVPRFYFEDALFPLPPEKDIVKIAQQIKTTFAIISQI